MNSMIDMILIYGLWYDLLSLYLTLLSDPTMICTNAGWAINHNSQQSIQLKYPYPCSCHALLFGLSDQSLIHLITVPILNFYSRQIHHKESTPGLDKCAALSFLHTCIRATMSHNRHECMLSLRPKIKHHTCKLSKKPSTKENWKICVRHAHHETPSCAHPPTILAGWSKEWTVPTERSPRHCPTLDGVFPSPFPRRRFVSWTVRLVDVCYFRNKWIVWVGVGEHGTDREKHWTWSVSFLHCRNGVMMEDAFGDG